MEVEPIHKSVLLKEVLDFLRIKPGEKYIDATLGQAGHSLEIAKAEGKVLGIEANLQTLEWVREYLKNLGNLELKDRIVPVKGNFRDLEKIAAENGFNQVSGILFDLGLSTFELKESGLGFSFQRDESLDMRIDPDSQEVTAGGLVNSLEKGELYGIFTKFGEERDAERIVSAIVRGRRIKKIETSGELASLIDSAYQPKLSRRELYKRLAKVFQSLRIVINDELGSLRRALPQALKLLKTDGVLCVISFHSLEDRVVKEIFAKWETQRLGSTLSRGPIEASRSQISANRATRSAKLRAFKKAYLNEQS